MGVDRPIDITPDQRKTLLSLLKRHLPNTTAWVYGSRVKWTARPQSDLDLVVFTKPDHERRVSKLREAFEESNLPFRVDLFVWDAVPEQFRKEIEAEHVVLVEKEEQVVPGDWVQTSLADLIDIRHGFAFKGSYINEEESGDVLLTPGNFAIGGGFKDDKFKYYHASYPEEFILGSGDLLVTMTDLSKQADTLGYPALVPTCPEGRRYLHNQRLGKVVIKDKGSLNARYLYYVLCSAEYRHEVLASATGTTVKHTSPERIKRFRFHLPSPPEQRAIAHVLGTLDDKIELNQRMNETLEAMARALFKSWFIDFDPVRAKMAGRDPGLPQHLADLFPDRLVDSELGPIPEAWNAKKLDECFNLTMGQSPPGSTYNEHGEGLPFFQGRTDFGFRYPENRKFCTAPTRIAQPGDTLVSVRAPVGDINMAWEQCCIGRGIAALRHKTASSSYSYYFTWTIQSALREYEQTGTVFGAINKNQFEALRVLEPDANIVDAFDSYVRHLDAKIRSSIAESLTLATLRDALLPKLTSGELRISRDSDHLVENIAQGLSS